MRIVSGSLRGRVLKIAKDLPVRPTTDMAREALFNILNSNFYFDEMEVLDLFAGTGAVSLEFVSRGVIKVTSVDNNPACIDGIKRNAELFNVSNIQLMRSDAMRFLSTCRKQYDMIFADPPFEFSQEEYEGIYNHVVERKLFKSGGWLILEHNKAKDFEKLPYYHSTRKYGKVHFSIFEFPEKEEDQ